MKLKTAAAVFITLTAIVATARAEETRQGQGAEPSGVEKELLPLYLKLGQLQRFLGENHPEVQNVKTHIALMRALYERQPDTRAGYGGGAILLPEDRVPPHAGKLVVRVYPVREFTDGDALLRVITTTIQPQSWAEHGGAATAIYFGEAKSLVIKQSAEAHKEIQELLGALRDGKQGDRPK